MVGVMGELWPPPLSVLGATLAGLNPLMAWPAGYVKPERVGETRPAKVREVGDSSGRADAAVAARSELDPKPDVEFMLPSEGLCV